MKKIPQPDDLPADVADESGQPAPLFPGTETPRSLGDMMREAEEAQTVVEHAGTPADAIPGATGANAKRGRVKKVSRSQARRYARERALQALYQWELGGQQSSDVRKQFLDEQDMSRVDVDYFVKLFNGVSHDPQTVDDAMQVALDRPLDSIDPVEKAVLRISTYELTQCLDIPARVVINEGIEITKRFGADKGHRYINGVLDKLAASVRPLEMRKR